MAQKEGKDNRWIIPGCDLQNLRGLCGNNVLVFLFSHQGIFLPFLYLENLDYFKSYEDPLWRRLGDVASHQLMLANLHVCARVCVCERECLCGGQDLSTIF